MSGFDSKWFTGSAVYEIDIMGPINQCYNLGFTHKDIVVDSIISVNPHPPHDYINSLTNVFYIFTKAA